MSETKFTDRQVKISNSAKKSPKTTVKHMSKIQRTCDAICLIYNRQFVLKCKGKIMMVVCRKKLQTQYLFVL